MANIGSMESNDFLQLIEESFKNEYVTKDDIKDFVTRKELTEIVDNASNHSTSIIRSAVRESVSEEYERSRINCRADTKNDFARIGIDLDKPQEMQEILVNLKKSTKNSDYARNVFVGYTIRTLVTSIVAVLLAGIAASLGGYIK